MPTNMTSQPVPITIAGAGIAGLVAAISLQRSGHQVTIFEQSSLAKEIGAAFSITPNANAILSRLGIDTHEGGAVDVKAQVFLDRNGNVMRENPTNPKFTDLPPGESYTFAHRYHLHEQLKKGAADAGAKLITGMRVSNIDTETLQISFEDGTSHGAQVILGADGVHSKVRESMYPQTCPFATQWALFRFMLDREEINKQESLFRGILQPGKLYIWGQSGTGVLAYPTAWEKKINFVCIFPTDILNIKADHDQLYSQKVSKDKVLDVFKTFDPRVRALIDMADPNGLRYWPLMDLTDVPSYVNELGTIALLGDAAHPFLPFAYQGAGLAIEDGAAIAALLSRSSTKEEVAVRLKQYEKLRHERCAWEQQFSRDMWKDHSNDKKWNPGEVFENIYLYRVLDEVEKIKESAAC